MEQINKQPAPLRNSLMTMKDKDGFGMGFWGLLECAEIGD